MDRPTDQARASHWLGRLLVPLLFFVPLPARAANPTGTARPNTPTARYGANPAAGGTFTHDGVKLYYETYGTGEPLLLLHGNGGSIADLGAQIDYFRRHYRVIAMDSRDHGLSDDGPDPLTYEDMTDDLAALLDRLRIRKANVIGWSDGGIEALLLAIRHPKRVRKIVAVSANLTPDAIDPDAIATLREMVDSISDAERQTAAGRRALTLTRLMLDEPHIDLTALEAIRAPTLVLASDHDVIVGEHTVAIHRHLPNSQLAIFPDATHSVPMDNPALFNATVDLFLHAPFVHKDRISQALQILDTLHAPTPQPDHARLSAAPSHP
ncbi:alpha/beta fold hydrolase [bacterium]|nr:alpha/beta fold hydrolase [bacterium]